MALALVPACLGTGADRLPSAAREGLGAGSVAVPRPALGQSLPVQPGCSGEPAYSKLHVEGDRIVNEEGCAVTLRGVTVEGVLGGFGMSFWGKYDRDHVDEASGEIVVHFAEVEANSRQEYGGGVGAIWDDWRDALLSQEDFYRIKELGFNVVRLWGDYRLFGDYGSPPRWQQSGFAAFERILDYAENAGVYVFYGVGGPFDEERLYEYTDLEQMLLAFDSASDTARIFDKPEAQARLLALHEEMARRYSHRTGLFAWDLLQEPITLRPSKVNALYAELISRIRAAEPASKTILALQPVILTEDLAAIEETSDENVMYSVHWYEPWTFTNMVKYAYPGFATYAWSDWLADEYAIYVGKQYNREELRRMLQPIVEFQQESHRPIFLDAGVLRANCLWRADGSRADWAGDGNGYDCPSHTTAELNAVQQWIVDNFDVFSEHGWHWSFTNYKTAGPASHGLYYTSSEYQDWLTGANGSSGLWDSILSYLAACVPASSAIDPGSECADYVIRHENWVYMRDRLRWDHPDTRVDVDKLPLLQSYVAM